MITKIKATKNLYNKGKCFIKNHIYTVSGNVTNEPGLMEKQVINEMGEFHIIGSWWRNFKIV